MNKIDISYASRTEHNLAQRLIIKTIEQITGKRKLQKIYSDFSKKNNDPRYFWTGILNSMEIKIKNMSNKKNFIPAAGSFTSNKKLLFKTLLLSFVGSGCADII